VKIGPPPRPPPARAAELGNPRVANVILLGALSRFVAIPAEIWLNAIAERVPPRFRELNRRAFELGRAAPDA
jgi:indolepyruvate ferredoxin oxidoreductase beta subunit